MNNSVKLVPVVCFHYIECICCRIPAVNNNRHIKLIGKVKLSCKPFLLYISFRLIIIVIKTYLTYRNNLFIGGKTFKPFHVAFVKPLDIFRMYTDRTVHKIMFFNNFKCLFGRRHTCAYIYNSSNTFIFQRKK